MSIIVKQLQKVQKHFDALKEYEEFIEKVEKTNKLREDLEKKKM